MAETTWKEQKREKRRVWTSHIKSWQSSGLSQVEYCRQNDLSRVQFTYWKCKLDKQKDPVTFVPLLGKPLQSDRPYNHQAPLKLIINSRYKIEVGDGFSPATLSTLIRTFDRL